MDEVEKRIARMSEGLLENESLTSHLDDESAQRLLQWGLALASMIGQQTTGLTDEEAEEATYAQFKAVRRLMKLINRWTPNRTGFDTETNLKFVPQILEQANIIYSDQLTLPDQQAGEGFVIQHLSDTNALWIANLQKFIEGTL